LSNRANSSNLRNILIFPTQDYLALAAFQILQFCAIALIPKTSPLVFISFSAGVVGAIGAAWGWQLLGGVWAFIAIDGWGVAAFGNFPIYRLSHDYFTHWSSALLGSGEDSFMLIHLWSIWKCGDRLKLFKAGGYTRMVGHSSIRLTAADFLLLSVPARFISTNCILPHIILICNFSHTIVK